MLPDGSGEVAEFIPVAGALEALGECSSGFDSSWQLRATRLRAPLWHLEDAAGEALALLQICCLQEFQCQDGLVGSQRRWSQVQVPPNHEAVGILPMAPKKETYGQ